MRKPASQKELLDAITSDCVRAYGDLRHPTFTFASQRLETEWGKEVLEALSGRFHVKDCTSLGSDDVCRSLFVGVAKRPEEWLILLSLVGRYAVATRPTIDAARWLITDSNANPSEQLILKTVRENGYTMVPFELLSATVPLVRQDSEQSTVYSALFSEAEPLLKPP